MTFMPRSPGIFSCVIISSRASSRQSPIFDVRYKVKRVILPRLTADTHTIVDLLVQDCNTTVRQFQMLLLPTGSAGSFSQNKQQKSGLLLAHTFKVDLWLEQDHLILFECFYVSCCSITCCSSLTSQHTQPFPGQVNFPSDLLNATDPEIAAGETTTNQLSTSGLQCISDTRPWSK